MIRPFAAALGGFTGLGGTEDGRERPVDRVGAAGAMQIERAEDAEREAIQASLGVDLMRYKWAGVERAGTEAELQLMGILFWGKWWKGGKCPLTPAERERVACWAVHEWANQACPPRPDGCGGKGEVPTAGEPVAGMQPMMTCPVCHGTTKRRWTDEERVEAMGSAFEEGMAEAHRIISTAEALALRRGRQLLERWTP